jgi:integrase
VRRPRADYESRAVALDRNEPGALLVAAGLGPPAGHGLISLLALNGRRVSETAGAGIEHLGPGRGHRTLTITREGGKIVTIPLAPRTARAMDLATGERTDGPVLLAADGRRLDRHGAGRAAARRQPCPACHLPRRRLRRRRPPATGISWNELCLAATAHRPPDRAPWSTIRSLIGDAPRLQRGHEPPL